MDSSIYDRLTNAESDFLQSVSEGGPALERFEERWTSLLSDIDNAVQSGNITDETKTLANVVSSRVAIFSENLFDLGTNARIIQIELEDLFTRIEIKDVDSPTIACRATPTFGERHTSPSPLSGMVENSLPMYIEPACGWLIGNLHNPYPSPEIRNSIALQTRCSRKSVDAWFIDARKRIGWNKLRRAHFLNKRADIVDAATQFFLPHDTKPPCDPNIGHKFAVIETNAKALYSERFFESPLAAKLDVAVKDLTPEMKIQVRADEKRRRQEEETRRCAEEDVQAALCYPSPHRSLSHTPELSPSPPPLNIELFHTESISGRKQRNASPGWDYEVPHNRPTKRMRPNHMSSLIDDTSTNLPSPVLSCHNAFETIQGNTCTHLPVDCLRTSRKRRLSDADSQGIPKRPRNGTAGPRLHAVSDPLPTSSTLSTWFQDTFGIAATPIVDEFDVSAPFEVEIFDYSNATTELDLTTRSLYQTPRTSPPSFETSLTLPEGSLDISSNNFDYNELFSEPVEDTLTNLPQGGVGQPNEFSFPAVSPTTFNFNFVHNILEPLPAIQDTAVIADSSMPLPQDLDSSFDWVFPPLLFSRDVYSTVQSLGFDRSAQDITLTVDPSKAALYTPGFPSDVIANMSTGADKAAKQRRLMEMKEATRRLEAEIAAS